MNKAVKRRADVVGIFLNDDNINRLIGASSSNKTTSTSFNIANMRLAGLTALAPPEIEEVPSL